MLYRDMLGKSGNPKAGGIRKIKEESDERKQKNYDEKNIMYDVI